MPATAAVAPTTTPPTPTTTLPIPDPAAGSGGPAPAWAALARCVGDPAAFLAEGIGTAPVVNRGGSFADLFSLDDADRSLTGHGLRRPAVRLVRDGEVIDPATWTRTARTGAARIDDLVEPGRALDAFADGATVVFQSMQRWWPPLAAFCDQLRDDLGHPTQTNAYLTPAGTSGLAAHHDTHDVFVLQVHGTKDWVLREPVVASALRHQRSDHDRAAEQPVHREVTLGPGDALYLPRGWVHSATSQRSASLHLTVGVLASTMHDVLTRLLDEAAEDLPALRRSFPAWENDPVAAGATATKEALATLTTWLDSLDASEVAGTELDRLARARRPELSGQLVALTSLDDIDDATLIRPRPEAVVARELTEGRLVLTTGDRRVSLPATLEATLGRLLTTAEPVQVGDLADALDEPSRMVLVRRLVREGVLTMERPA